MAYTTINKSTENFNTKLYTGNAGTQSITGVGFQPDLTWIKRRNTTGGNMWTDAVRGVTKTIISNETSAEQTFANGLTAFGTDGFTVGSEGGFNSANTIASWNWKAGNSAGSSNSNGSITSTVSANTTAGFSIVKYTGTGSNATIGHGLGVAPSMIIIKNLTSGRDWLVYHKELGNTHGIYLDLTNASTSSSGFFNNTSPTSSVFSVGTDTDANDSSDDTIAYCFAEKKGYSKFGSYVGNGNADGTFTYTGFKPAFLITKRTDSSSSGDWNIVDSVRNPSNVVNKYLHTNLSQAEGTASIYDFYSNGFKIRESGAGTNASGSTYVYLAFAEEPLVANVGQGIPATAR